MVALFGQGVFGPVAFFIVFWRERGATATRLDRLTEVAEGALPEGAELVEARFSGGPLLTLLVDRTDGGAVDHEFCAMVAQRISPVLDEEGYDGLFEVSSPGIERPLTKPEHYRRFVGREAKVRTVEPVEGGPHDGRRNFTGRLEQAGEGSFVMGLFEGGTVELPYGSVARAQLKEDLQIP